MTRAPTYLEAVEGDIAGWLRGLEGEPLTPEQQCLIDKVRSESSALFGSIRCLKESFERE